MSAFWPLFMLIYLKKGKKNPSLRSAGADLSCLRYFGLCLKDIMQKGEANV